MIARTPQTDDILRRYRESFEEVERVLSLHEGFVLQPLECVDAEIALALGAFLEAHGWQARWFAPEGTEGARVLDEIMEVRDGADARPLAVILFGPERPPPALLEGIGALNRKRDAVIATLKCPLLWCGPPGFHVASWGAMPDFWSVRALPMSLKGEAPAVNNNEQFRPWRWSRFQDGEVDRIGELEALREAAAARGRALDAARFCARIAVARAAQGDAKRALADLDQKIAELLKSPALLILSSYDPANPLIAEVRPVRIRLLVALGDVPGARAEIEVDRRTPTTTDRVYAAELLGALTRPPSPFADAEAARLAATYGNLFGGNIIAALGERNALGGRYGNAAMWLERAIETLARAGDQKGASMAAEVLTRVLRAQDQSRAALESNREAASRSNPGSAPRLSGATLTRDQRVTLRRALVNLYPDRRSIRRVFADASLSIERINLEWPPGMVWLGGIEEAERSGRTLDLLQVALRDYPANAELRSLLDDLPRRAAPG